MSSAYRSLFINTSREMMQYAAYPMPEDYPDYPHHSQIARCASPCPTLICPSREVVAPLHRVPKSGWRDNTRRVRPEEAASIVCRP
jgi:hypothetical protein